MDILAASQAEFNAIFAERKKMTALTRDIPPAADRFYKLEEEVLAYSEKEKKRLGPLIVVDVIGRMITVQTLDGTKRNIFDAFQIKPYYRALDLNLYSFQTNRRRRHPSQICLTEVI